MKNIFLFTLIILASVTGCEEIDKLTQFDMEYDEKVVIPSSAGVGLPFDLVTPDIESDSESKFSVNNTNKDLVEEIVLKKMDLTLTAPSDGDLSFLQSIEIFISADDLPEEKIAWKDDVPSDVGKYLELETVETDLKEYIKKDEFTLRVNTVTNKILASDHHIDIHSVFFVDAEVLGI
jgi:hypothetical protein